MLRPSALRLRLEEMVSAVEPSALGASMRVCENELKKSDVVNKPSVQTMAKMAPTSLKLRWTGKALGVSIEDLLK